MPLEFREALCAGSSIGVARTNEYFGVGIPIADSAALTNVNALDSTSHNVVPAAQFRVDSLPQEPRRPHAAATSSTFVSRARSTR